MTPCTFCGRPWHPSTGAEYGPRSRACAHCVVEVWEMLLARMNGKPSRRFREFWDFACPFCNRARTPGPSFYDHISGGGIPQAMPMEPRAPIIIRPGEQLVVGTTTIANPIESGCIVMLFDKAIHPDELGGDVEWDPVGKEISAPSIKLEENPNETRRADDWRVVECAALDCSTHSNDSDVRYLEWLIEWRGLSLNQSVPLCPKHYAELRAIVER